MAQAPEFESDVTRKAWEAAGSPYCEHPHFPHDRDTGWMGKRPDVTDYYCDTCGALWPGRSGEKPAPTGVKPD